MNKDAKHIHLINWISEFTIDSFRFVSGIFLDPQDFVRHLHTDRENRTCHWGFDPVHWRCYIHLDETVYKKSKKPEKSDQEPDKTGLEEPNKTGLSVADAHDVLNDVKSRFVHSTLKRKQVGSNHPFDFRQN